MPPRRSSHFKHVPMQRSSVMESMASKLERLRPAEAVEHSDAPTPAASGPDGAQAASSSGIYRPVESTFTRSDAPVIRNVRRGSATEALSSLHELGESALVEELLQDSCKNRRSMLCVSPDYLASVSS